VHLVLHAIGIEEASLPLTMTQNLVLHAIGIEEASLPLTMAQKVVLACLGWPLLWGEWKH